MIGGCSWGVASYLLDPPLLLSRTGEPHLPRFLRRRRQRRLAGNASVLVRSLMRGFHPWIDGAKTLGVLLGCLGGLGVTERT